MSPTKIIENATIKTAKRLSQNEYFWLIIIILLGFSLRLYGLDDFGVNNDEAIVYDRWISESFRKIMVDDLLLNNHIFAQILARAAILALGNKLFALRWPACCISVLGIPLIYRIAAGFYGKRIGVFSALLLAMSTYAIFYAHTFRGYSGVVTFPLLAYVLALFALQTKKWRYWIGLGFLSGVMIYTHMFMMITLFNLMLFIGFVWLLGTRSDDLHRPSSIQVTVSFCITIILLLLLYFPLWTEILQNSLDGGSSGLSAVMWVQRPEVPASLVTNLSWFGGFPDRKSFAGQPGWPGVYIFLGLVIIGLVVGLRRFQYRTLILLGSALLPFLEIWLLQQILPAFWARPQYLGYTLPPLLILVALALVESPGYLSLKKIPPLTVTLGILALLIIFWLFTIGDTFRIFATGNWRSVGNFLQQNSQADDLVVCHIFNNSWREIDPEDLCTRTLNYRRHADTNMAAPVSTSHQLIYEYLPKANAGVTSRSGGVWLVVWDLPDSVNFTPDAAVSVTEFKGFGRTVLLRADQPETYAANLTQDLNILRSAAQSQEQRYLFNLLTAISAAASGQKEIADEALELAGDNKPEHQDSAAKLEQTKRLVEQLSPPPIDHPLEAEFGKLIMLKGYNISSAEVEPGATLDLTFFWQAVQPIQQNYAVFLHVRDQAGNTVTQLDYRPLGNIYPTQHWQPGQLLVDAHEFQTPLDFVPGTYQLIIGFYNPTNMERLPLLDDVSGENALYLTSLIVTPPQP